MARLSVILKHGFENDRAVVKINGETVLDRAGLTTRTTVDRATAFDHDVPDGRARIEIQLPDRRLARTLQVDARGHMSVVVSVSKGSLEAEIVDGIVGDA